MKKLILSLLVIITGTFVNAQTSELRIGTVLVKNYPQGESPVVKFSYLIEDSSTKEVYLTEETSLELTSGQEVDYALIERRDFSRPTVGSWFATNGTCQEMSDGRCQCGPANMFSQEMVTNMQKSRQDAMMAVIQNTR